MGLLLHLARSRALVVGCFATPLIGRDGGRYEEVFSGHILMEDFMEGLREGCSSCRASGPAARAMVMSRCFPASCTVSQKAQAWVEGRCSWLPGKLGQEERGEGRKAEIGLHGC